jgi:lipid II:glycine glycyltransferase (peptidoglycan interpeptide bridge formation enzyme)
VYDKALQQVQGTFLQSWEWGAFQEKRGRQIVRFVVQGEGDVMMPVLMIQMKLPLGLSWWYIPHVRGEEVLLEEAFAYAKKVIQQAGGLALYCDPGYFLTHEMAASTVSSLSQAGFIVHKEQSIQPQATFGIKLDDADSLLQHMHKKTRYNIRLAQKKGIEIIWSNEQKYIDAFIELTQRVASRQNITSHSVQYYQDLIQLDMCQLVSAVIDGQVVASHILVTTDTSCIYLHGASDYAYRSFMAPYLLQYEGLLFAIEQGLSWYDFWGIDSGAKNTQRWQGITRFKKGFFEEEKYGESSESGTHEYCGLYIYKSRPILFYIYRLIRFFKDRIK